MGPLSTIVPGKKHICIHWELKGERRFKSASCSENNFTVQKRYEWSVSSSGSQSCTTASWRSSISSISIWILSDTLPVPCQSITVVFIHEAVNSWMSPEWDCGELTHENKTVRTDLKHLGAGRRWLSAHWPIHIRISHNPTLDLV